MTKKKAKFKRGDLVRLVKLGNKFQRSYKGVVNPEKFEIINVNTRMPIPMYQIQSIEKDEEGPIEGMFYGEELSIVRSLRLKVIESRPETGQVLVRWLDRSPEEEGLIKERYIENKQK